eukprot:TRINITY_DN5143_c0_g1_i1.p1 TRINITY_DN5143_c0_g1~~TRINITY_DN5143_c0_g1_i1.p1  ORF type:complete len:579 (-),score=23.81 TRINITY_DN5143_c0_g1_i1:417-2153(-)
MTSFGNFNHLKPVALGICLTALSLPFANNAHALSNGCSAWDDTNAGIGSFSTSGAFEKGEVVKIAMSSPSNPLTYNFIYTDIANGNATITKSDTFNGGTLTVDITIPINSSNASLSFNTGAETVDLTVSCTAAPPAESGGSGATTTSQVVSAVSRSQTTVIQQNIGARVSAVTGSVGGSVGGAGGAGSGTGGSNTGGATGNAGAGSAGSGTGSGNGDTLEGTSFAGLDTPNHSNTDDNQYALRRLAMISDFDSSQGSIGILGLGPTDQGTVGGAGGVDGRSALDTSSPFTVWGHGSFTSVDNDYVSGTADNRYDGDVWGYNVGLDYSFAPALTAGVSLGYNDTDLTTTFNSGTYQEKGWVISPYAIYRPIANLNVVAEVGFGQGEIDVTRDNNSVQGDTDSVLWYAALRGSYRTTPIGELPFFSVTPSLGLIAARKTVDSYTESNGTTVASTRSNTRQINPSVEASYDLYPTRSLVITPFGEAGLVYDFTDEINNDATAFNIGGGLRLSDQATGLNAALEASYLAGRTEYKEYTIGGTVTYGFGLYDSEGRNLGIVKPFFCIQPQRIWQSASAHRDWV